MFLLRLIENELLPCLGEFKYVIQVSCASWVVFGMAGVSPHGSLPHRCLEPGLSNSSLLNPQVCSEV